MAGANWKPQPVDPATIMGVSGYRPTAGPGPTGALWGQGTLSAGYDLLGVRGLQCGIHAEMAAKAHRSAGYGDLGHDSARAGARMPAHEALTVNDLIV
jgi:hypothetical protein